MGAAGYASSFHIRDVSEGVSASVVPRLCAVILMILGLLLGGSPFLKKGGCPGETEGEKGPPEVKSVGTVSILAVFIVYAAALKGAGYLIATPVFMFLLMMILCPAQERRPGRFLLISVLVTAVIYGVFVLGFQVQLPAGILK